MCVTVVNHDKNAWMCEGSSAIQPSARFETSGCAKHNRKRFFETYANKSSGAVSLKTSCCNLGEYSRCCFKVLPCFDNVTDDNVYF